MTDQVDLGAVTLAVIASSFVSFIAFFHLLDHFRLYAKLQPKHDKVTRKEWGIVARMTLTNLVWLVPGTLLSGPVLEVFLLPYSDPLPWFPAPAVKILVFLFLDDVFFYAYHRLLHSFVFLFHFNESLTHPPPANAQDSGALCGNPQTAPRFYGSVCSRRLLCVPAQPGLTARPQASIRWK